MPLWFISLLSTTSVGEFLYEDAYFIRIKGVMIKGEWVVDIQVKAIPYFAWGCNKLHTGMNGSFKAVVRYYLAVVLNQLSERGAKGKESVLKAIKDNLE